MSTALILIDIQQDYFPGGRMELAGAVKASDAAKRLLTTFREKGLYRIHIQHISTRPGATFFLPETDGVDFHTNVKPLPDEAVIRKHYPNSFKETELGHALQNEKVQQLVIGGMMSHMCIDATVRAAFDDGYQCIVAHDACATRSLAFDGMNVPAEHVHAAFMAALGSVYAKVMSTDEVMKMLG